MDKNPLRTLALLFAFALLTPLFFFPVVWLFVQGGVGVLVLAPLDWWGLVHILALTYGQAFLSAVCAMGLGTLGAFVFVEKDFVGKHALARLALLSFSLPTVLVALAFVGVWGRSGYLNSVLGSEVSFYGWPMILLAHTFLNYVFFQKALIAALTQSGRLEEKSALALGATRRQTLLLVTLPKIWPAMRGAFYLAFLYCSLSFLIVLLLGGGPQFTTLSVAIFEAVKVDFDLPLAVALGTTQVLFGLLFSLWGRRAIKLSPGREVFVRLYQIPHFVFALYLLSLFLIVILPISSLAIDGIKGILLSQQGLLSATLSTLMLGFLTSVISLALAFCLSYAAFTSPKLKWAMESLASWPLLVSSLLMALAILITYADFADVWRDNVFLISALQAIAALPIVFRPVMEAFERNLGSYSRVAQALGASPMSRLRLVELPLIKRSLLVAALVGFAYSLGEVSFVLLLVGEHLEPLPLLLFRQMTRYRFVEASAVGLVLLILIVGVQIVLEKMESYEFKS